MGQGAFPWALPPWKHGWAWSRGRVSTEQGAQHSLTHPVQASWRRTVSTGVQAGIPMPCFTTALSFYDGYRHELLPANLIQVSRCCLPAGRRGPRARAGSSPPHLLSRRLSGITSGLTPTNSWPSQDSSSTPTGRAMAAACRPPPTTPRRGPPHRTHSTRPSLLGLLRS